MAPILPRLAPLAALAAILATGPGVAAAQGETSAPQTRPRPEPGADPADPWPQGARLPSAPWRGTGILILDPRDPVAEVKARLKKFVLEVRSNIPPERRQEEIDRQVDSLLESDLTASGEMPQLSFLFREEIGPQMLRSFMEETPSARDSQRVCPASCPVAAMYRDGVHVHLTRPAGGAGDSVVAMEFHAERPGQSRADSQQASLEEARRRRRNLLERYPELGYERRPIGHLFGVRVYLGEPPAPEGVHPLQP